jgi:hypothetical protein
MRTVKVKKEIHRSYSFANAHDHWSRDSRDEIEKGREDVLEDDVEGPFSDIVETIYYAEVEEQVPHAVERWYFAASGDHGDLIHMRKNFDLDELRTVRERLMREGFSCSEIKLLREEF